MDLTSSRDLSAHVAARLKGSPFWKSARLCLLQRDELPIPRPSRELRSCVYTRRSPHVYLLFCSRVHKSARSGAVRTENVNLPSERSACAISADVAIDVRLPDFLRLFFHRFPGYENEFKNAAGFNVQSTIGSVRKSRSSQVILVSFERKLESFEIRRRIYDQNRSYSHFSSV